MSNEIAQNDGDGESVGKAKHGESSSPSEKNCRCYRQSRYFSAMAYGPERVGRFRHLSCCLRESRRSEP